MAKRRKRRSKSVSLNPVLVVAVLIVGGFMAIFGNDSNTPDPTPQPTARQQSISTSQPRATRARSETATPRATRTPAPLIRYVSNNANLRTCARIDNQQCPVSGSVAAGERLRVIDTVDGDEFQGSDTWYRVEIDGDEFYIHSELTTSSRPTTSTTGDTSSQQVQSTVPPNTNVSQPTQPPAAASCPSSSATCSQLTCEQAYACLALGQSRLDRDGDGVPCEEVCPGG